MLGTTACSLLLFLVEQSQDITCWTLVSFLMVASTFLGRRRSPARGQKPAAARRCAIAHGIPAARTGKAPPTATTTTARSPSSPAGFWSAENNARPSDQIRRPRSPGRHRARWGPRRGAARAAFPGQAQVAAWAQGALPRAWAAGRFQFWARWTVDDENSYFYFQKL